MDIRKLIEEINALTEDELVDEFEAPAVEEVEEEEVVEENNDTTTELDAKTRISRALDALKKELDYFKQVTAEEIDLVNDSMLNSNIEQLVDDVWAIESVLKGDAVEEPKEDIENVEDNTENEADEIEDEEISFDDEASLDLFADEDEEIEDEE